MSSLCMLHALITNIIFFQEKTKSKIDNSEKFYVDVRKKYNYQKIVLYLWCNILILMRYDSKNLCGQFVPFEGIV